MYQVRRITSAEEGLSLNANVSQVNIGVCWPLTRSHLSNKQDAHCYTMSQFRNHILQSAHSQSGWSYCSARKKSPEGQRSLQIRTTFGQFEVASIATVLRALPSPRLFRVLLLRDRNEETKHHQRLLARQQINVSTWVSRHNICNQLVSTTLLWVRVRVRVNAKQVIKSINKGLRVWNIDQKCLRQSLHHLPYYAKVVYLSVSLSFVLYCFSE